MTERKTIYLDDALEAIRKLPNAGIHWFVSAEAVFNSLLELPSAQPEQRWIPCSERLPDDETDILVTYIDGEETRIVPVNYGRGTWFDCIFDRELKHHMVIAWMPLPEPWEGGAK